MQTPQRLYTFGHGTADEIALSSLLRSAGVRAVVDVRSVPKSRAHPHVWAQRLAQWVPDLAGASYSWSQDLGGFRKPLPESPNVALRHPSFRGYADYMQTDAFAGALGRLVAGAAAVPTAIMCSETLWWRCHRRLISDALVLTHAVRVEHLMHAGAPQVHRLTEGVRLRADGRLQYDVIAPPDQ
ncbi:MAG: DUF488 domain-containing protein [Candidatus Eremiobacteraeota bacterium]|nr:DUF488 domain-containing protein [Candidatus Eremiobacteraeota bacterium]